MKEDSPYLQIYWESQTFLETESLNGAWWYMSAAFVFIILLPPVRWDD